MLGLKLNHLAFRVKATACDIGAWQTLEKIIGRAILLEDDDHMLNGRHPESGQPTHRARTGTDGSLARPLTHRQTRRADSRRGRIGGCPKHSVCHVTLETAGVSSGCSELLIVARKEQGAW